MTDFLALAVWPLAIGVFAAFFGLFMCWLINKQHPIEAKDRKKPTHTMAE